MNTVNLTTLKIHRLTQTQYDREKAAGTLDNTALYLTPDSSSSVSVTESNDGNGNITITIGG